VQRVLIGGYAIICGDTLRAAIKTLLASTKKKNKNTNILRRHSRGGECAMHENGATIGLHRLDGNACVSDTMRMWSHAYPRDH